MRSIRELMEEHERLDQALRKKYRDSVEGLEPIPVHSQMEVPATESESAQTEELGELTDVEIPAQEISDVQISEELAEVDGQGTPIVETPDESSEGGFDEGVYGDSGLRPADDQGIPDG